MGCVKPLILQGLFIKAANLTLKIELEAKFTAWGISDHTGNTNWIANLREEYLVTVDSQGMFCPFHSMPRSEVIHLPCRSVWCEAWERLERVGSEDNLFLCLSLLWGPHSMWVSAGLVSWSQPTPPPNQAVKTTGSQVPLNLQMASAWSWPWLSTGLYGFLPPISVWPLRIPDFLTHSCLHLKICYLYFS